MNYNIYEKKTGNLLLKIKFYDNRIKKEFFKHFMKLKRQIDVVEVYE